MNTSPDQKQTAHTAGDWAVWDSTSGFFGDHRYEANEIVKATGKTVTLKLRHTGDYRKNASAVLWSGAETEAKALAERLNSSVGLMKDEVRRSRERHKERAEAAIARATGSSSQSGGE